VENGNKEGLGYREAVEFFIIISKILTDVSACVNIAGTSNLAIV
jgi:hypothetical protein